MESKKYIHYCWFGGKPLPKLANKCIKSWKKYLPDYEIIRWDESNVDLNECPFIKGAYDNKKWAFVADYVRSKAMYEMGGIYFDTDMEITKNIDELMKDDSFIGVEDSGYIACGAWYEKDCKSGLSKYLLDFYRKQKSFNIDEMYKFSIPKLITTYLNDFGFDFNNHDTQKLSNGTVVYSREYFYPLSYDRQNNLFTDNTCMIHYYDASWVPKSEQRTLALIRLFGRDRAIKLIELRIKLVKLIKRIIKICTFPVYFFYIKNKVRKQYIKKENEFSESLDKYKGNDYIAFCNKDWFGTKSSTIDLFGDNTFEFYELEEKEKIKFYTIDPKDNIGFYANKICDMKFKMIIFSSFCKGWTELIKEIRKRDNKVIIKVLWHGSNAMHLEDYDWEVFNSMFTLLKEEKVNSIGFVKKSMYEYYKELGYNVEFVMNTVKLDPEIVKSVEPHSGIRIGLYASGNRWVKNFYNQFAGASLVKDATVDVIPLNERIKEFSNILGTNVTGETSNISREEMLKRLGQNDINLNCTFVECAPITPLESLEMGVPCITGDNHHYWEGTELEKYLVLDKVDNSKAIADRIELCLNNKEKIIKLYNEWKKQYDRECEKNNKKFINFK